MCYTIIVRRGRKMKSYSSREVIQKLKEDGWYEVNIVGSHHQFKHPVKKGRVTVKHPDKDIPLKTLKSIERQSGLTF
jgi:predicted RNA binding protein YcfA (HicA-like mRNA interferase family)